MANEAPEQVYVAVSSLLRGYGYTYLTAPDCGDDLVCYRRNDLCAIPAPVDEQIKEGQPEETQDEYNRRMHQILDWPPPRLGSPVNDARLRNQAENIVYAVFGYPPSAVIGRNSVALVRQIFAALKIAHASAAPVDAPVKQRVVGEIAMLLLQNQFDEARDLALTLPVEQDTDGPFVLCPKPYIAPTSDAQFNAGLEWGAAECDRLEAEYLEKERKALAGQKDANASYYDGKATACSELGEIIRARIERKKLCLT